GQRGFQILFGYRPAECAARDVGQYLRGARQFILFARRMTDEDARPVRRIDVCIAGDTGWSCDLNGSGTATASATAKTTAASGPWNKRLQSRLRLNETPRRRCDADFVDAGLHRDATIGGNSSAIQNQNAAPVQAELILAVRRE